MTFEIEIEIAQSEDRCWRFCISPDAMWIGGFDTYRACYEAAVMALRKAAVDLIRTSLQAAGALETHA